MTRNILTTSCQLYRGKDSNNKKRKIPVKEELPLNAAAAIAITTIFNGQLDNAWPHNVLRYY